MTEINTGERIERMIRIIEDEAKEEVIRLGDDAKTRAKKQKIKQINTKRDQIDTEFEKKRKILKFSKD